MQKVELEKIEISKLQSRVKCSWFLPSLRGPQDPNPMAYRHLDSVYVTGPLDIAAHTRTGPLVRAPDLMGISWVRTAAAPELIPARRCHSAHPTMAHDMTLRLGALTCCAGAPGTGSSPRACEDHVGLKVRPASRLHLHRNSHAGLEMQLGDTGYGRAVSPKNEKIQIRKKRNFKNCEIDKSKNVKTIVTIFSTRLIAKLFSARSLTIRAKTFSSSRSCFERKT
jgi:hypothetical protein